MSKIINNEFLAAHGESLVENGYNIIPIPEGSKAPGFEGWQKIKATRSQVKDWLASGYKNAGIGILTEHTPAVDLDISDARVCKRISDEILLNYGDAPIRVGREPRSLLMFKTNSPFRKMKTGKFQDEWGDTHEVEILAQGQQFVAYANHKDTGKPYKWISETQPTNLSSRELPNIDFDIAEEIIRLAVRIFEEEGFKRVSNGLSGKSVNAADADDAFSYITQTINLPSEEIRRILLSVPGNDVYETWTQVGMALYHQYDGSPEGLSLWHDWSESADNYGKDELDKKWRSFDIQGKKRSPVTFATVIKMAKAVSVSLVTEQVGKLRQKFYDAKDQPAWYEACASVSKSDIPTIARSEICEIARKRYFELTTTKIPLADVRRVIAYVSNASEDIPNWCKQWVYDTQTDKYFHVITKVTMSIRSFDMINAQFALSKKDVIDGKLTPTHTPSEIVMNIHKIEQVHGQMYAPTEDDVFTIDGLRIANTYPAFQIPQVPDNLSSKDKIAVRRVKAHIAHILEDEKEQRLLLDWLAWIVQNPGERMNWALVLQGVEGDGKSFFGSLLRAVMGHSNVRVLNANVLESSFTGWSYGQCVTVIEEPRLHGTNKYDVLNKMKTFITNPIIEVHAKGKDPFNIPNTVSYFLPTNYRDALPLSENDRRYGVLFSRWQERIKLIEFMRENPDYYLNLYNCIYESAPGLRKWLLDLQVGADFPGGKDAPRTKSHKYMVDSAAPHLITAINEIINEGTHHDITHDIVNVTALPDILIGSDYEIEKTSGLSRVMENNGYTYLGRFRIDRAEPFCRYWSKSPLGFYFAGKPSYDKIKKYLIKSKDELL